MLVTAASDIKFFGETGDITAFTVDGLVNGDTVASFTEFSPGTPPSASVAGSPYPIKLSEASGGTFVPSNYRITYVDGLLTVLPPLPLARGRMLADPPKVSPTGYQLFINTLDEDM
jgi:hypothetical protein